MIILLSIIMFLWGVIIVAPIVFIIIGLYIVGNKH